MQSEHGIQGTPSTDQASEHGPSAYVTLSTAGATRRSRSASWLYRIHAAPNIIDASTRDCEQETHIFALGGVPWTQVMAWSEVNFDSDVELIQHRVKESGFTPNPDYNSDGFGALDAHVVSPSSDWRFTGAEFWNPRDHYDAPRLSRQHWTTHMASLPECARQALGFDVDFPLVFGRGNSPISSQRSTCLQRPTLSHSANPVSLLNTPQVLTAIDYLSSTDEPCNVASLDVSARQQTLGTDALLFRSIVRLSCQNEHALRSVSPSSEAVLDRLAEGYEPATCHLIAMCNNFLQDQRGR
ncbi:putative enterotoxin [Ophiocordyceps australis]|uniref:Putative enterotoxin n=1 Tax=Ophiocordyceps australis TaxID=1399860 RepID=A0A2C5YZH0_9HYPO|nr:putative enterotoxin [Ophiocordyceps australis]